MFNAATSARRWKTASVDTSHDVERRAHDVFIGEEAMNRASGRSESLQRRLDPELASHVMGAGGDNTQWCACAGRIRGRRTRSR